MELTDEKMVARLQEMAAIGQATCFDIRLNRPSTTSLVTNVAMTILTAELAVWTAITGASLIVPILFAATSLVALAYTTYKIYLWIQSPSEERCLEWEYIFYDILEGRFSRTVERLETIVNCAFPDRVKDIVQVRELGNRFRILSALGYSPVPFALLMAHSLACAYRIFPNPNKAEEVKRKISNWTPYIDGGDELFLKYVQMIDGPGGHLFLPAKVQKPSCLILAHIWSWTKRELKQESPKSEKLFATTKSFVRRIAPSITVQSVGPGNYRIFQSMLASKTRLEFHTATMEFNRGDLLDQATAIPN